MQSKVFATPGGLKQKTQACHGRGPCLLEPGDKVQCNYRYMHPLPLADTPLILVMQ